MSNFIIYTIFFILPSMRKGICGDVPELENPCEDRPFPKTCEEANGLSRFFYDRFSKSCVGSKCQNEGGFGDLVTCANECEKHRSVRKVSSGNKFGVLADFEITAPKKLSIATKRRFPLSLCELEWDSGLICPGIRRGSYLDQFHYDQKSNTCEHFIYNGCGGNANRYRAKWMD
ncbi:unnamed protein product [Allacma fusca]|uniref:BPTI/Kunitz inhibitor domain-containing protein n=1 Tax=Allacma fusca TaxID=39272 RepID=A0A8J2K0T9_9HEXA|nr:unnamed protein product [Allacma fusca]